jgi:hypothetical protein
MCSNLGGSIYFAWLNFLINGARRDKGHKFHGSTAHEIGGSDSKLRACSLDEPIGLEPHAFLWRTPVKEAAVT